MWRYFLRRFLLIVPTLFGIMLISFVIIQFLPGGPIERIIIQLQGLDASATGRIGGGGMEVAQHFGEANANYRGAQGLDPKYIAELEKQFGFDQPAYSRFFTMIRDFALFNFGKSFFRDIPVLKIIAEKLPVSISLGLWMTFFSYLISIPLGIRKAIKHGSRFDIWSSSIIIIGYAVPGFVVAIFLTLLFAGGSFWQIFPLRGLVSEQWEELPLFAQLIDYFWHLTLPLIALSLGAFATLTFLTKNSFLDEIHKFYVQTARMKGLTESRVLLGHVFRNAMIIIIAGFPSAFIHTFFTGSLLIETTFNLDGLGLLSFESLLNRDYPIVMANLYILSLLGLCVNLLSDALYMIVDPRIDFERGGRS